VNLSRHRWTFAGLGAAAALVGVGVVAAAAHQQPSLQLTTEGAQMDQGGPQGANAGHNDTAPNADHQNEGAE
jgi:hypothetical protein